MTYNNGVRLVFDRTSTNRIPLNEGNTCDSCAQTVRPIAVTYVPRRVVVRSNRSDSLVAVLPRNTCGIVSGSVIWLGLVRQFLGSARNSTVQSYIDTVWGGSAGMPFTSQSDLPPAMSEAARSQLILIIKLAYIFGTIVCIVGIVLACIGSKGVTEIRLFGQTFSSSCVGIGAIFLAVVGVTVIVLKVIKRL